MKRQRKNMSREKNLTVEEFNSLLDEIDYTKPEIKVSKCTVSFTFSDIKYNCSLTGEKRMCLTVVIYGGNSVSLQIDLLN